MEVSEKDLEYAGEFRAELHREALALVKQTRPDATEVFDPYPPEAYLDRVWDYPGTWYPVTAVPQGFKSRAALVGFLAENTLRRLPPAAPAEERALPAAPESAPDGAFPDDPVYALVSGLEGLVADYCVVDAAFCLSREEAGGEAHRRALALASQRLFAGSFFDTKKAKGTKTDLEAQLSPQEPSAGLTYRRAFFCPPHGSGLTEADFKRVNAALFPDGVSGLEAFSWSTDWADRFSEGNEWWGALCLTVYDEKRGRFLVIAASATD